VNGLFDEFAGHRSLSEAELDSALQNGIVVIDTNVLLDLYAFEGPARDSAITLLTSVAARLFIPHQVAREFWRNRARAIYDSRPKSLAIDPLRQAIFQVLNALVPDKARTTMIENAKTEIDGHLKSVEKIVSELRGTPLNVGQALADTNADPVLSALDTILSDRVGAAWSKEEERVEITEGLRRFGERIPPGFEDADKLGQVEQGTGDYLAWKQALTYIASQDPSERFVYVTSDSKSDWRARHPSKAEMLGVRPELVQEAIDVTGVGFALLTPDKFYRLLGQLIDFDEEKTETLVAASSMASRDDVREGASWPEGAFAELLLGLADRGYSDQATLIIAVARAGGSIDARELEAMVEASPHTNITEFVRPVKFEHVRLMTRGVIPTGAPAALSMMKNRAGVGISVIVPPEFVDFQNRIDVASNGTWVDQAELVMESDGDRWWTVAELVEEIGGRGLRDLSVSRTPEKTLRRDMTLRAPGRFEVGASGFRLQARPDRTS